MALFARVAVESNLLQLDREFDFRVPAALEADIKQGQRVSFALGRSKKEHTGFVTELLSESPFATSELRGLIAEHPQITTEQLRFLRKVADRQVCALGELLSLAVPEHMPRISEKLKTSIGQQGIGSTFSSSGRELRTKAQRKAILSSPRKALLDDRLVPEWIRYLDKHIEACMKSGASSLVVLPERDDVDRFLLAVSKRTYFSKVIDFAKSKKSERFSSYQEILATDQSVVVGTRASIFAPVRNLGLIAVYDDLDQSHRSESAPFTNTRELALIRAAEEIDLVFIAPYRSTELQRLVEIGYLESVVTATPPVKFSFTEPSSRIDEAAFRLIREALGEGPVLILVPRKGMALAAYCRNCSERIRCTNCSGVVWQNAHKTWNCRLCNSPSTLCQACGHHEFRPGRAGSTRTVAELGKAFPGVLVTEVSQEKPLNSIRPKQQLVVATAGSLPSYVDQFAAVVIIDCDIWLGHSSLMSEEFALRDWMESLQLLANDGRALAVGLSASFGKVIALGQHEQFARSSFLAAKELGLPPALRYAEISGAKPLMEELTTELLAIGVEVVRVSHAPEGLSTLAIKFGYTLGLQVSAKLREYAIKSIPVAGRSGNKRGLRIVMDDLSRL